MDGGLWNRSCLPLNLSLKRNRFRAAEEKKFTRSLPVLYNFVLTASPE
jgi:hypothetical protein